jgi:hypothetical protein
MSEDKRKDRGHAALRRVWHRLEIDRGSLSGRFAQTHGLDILEVHVLFILKREGCQSGFAGLSRTSYRYDGVPFGQRNKCFFCISWNHGANIRYALLIVN